MGVVDFPTMLERNGKLEDTKISLNMNNQQLEDYLSILKGELNVKYLDLGEYYYHDEHFDENYDTKTEVAKIRNKAIEFKLKSNEKPVRMIAIKNRKNYLAKEEYKMKLGIVTRINSKSKSKKK